MDDGSRLADKIKVVTSQAGRPIVRLGVIGDAHAEDSRLCQALTMLAGESVDAIVCTGDLVDGTGSPDAVVRDLRRAGVHTVLGNHDRWLLEDKARHVPDAHLATDLETGTVDYLKSLPRECDVETSRGPLLLCHGVGRNDLRKVWPGSARMPPERSRRLDKIIAQGRYRFVLNGHMHFRVLVHFPDLTLINAGTLQGVHKPGFSVLDFDRNEVTPFTFATEDAREPGDRADGGEVIDEPMHRMPPHSMQPIPGRRVWRNTQEFDGNWEPTRLF
jgi:predicted phosphodiesterase